MKHKMLNGIDPNEYLKEHIIRGDKGDGIPNILSDDDCIVNGVRQKPISKKKVANWIVQDPSEFNDDMKRGWLRNKILIDFDLIPKDISDAILKYSFGGVINPPTPCIGSTIKPAIRPEVVVLIKSSMSSAHATTHSG